MAAHLLEPTLPTAAAEMARYYQAGVDALSPEDRALAVLAKRVADGEVPFADAAALIATADAGKAMPTPGAGETDEVRAVGLGVARGMMGPMDSLDVWSATEGLALAAAGASPDALSAAQDAYVERVQRVADAHQDLMDQIEARTPEAEGRLNAAILAHQNGAAEPTAAEPRRDMHPEVASLLGIDAHRSVSAEELAHLLSGRRSDGEEIAGASKGKTISFVDCCFSADKSVSLAWAFAPTEAERNQVMQAHRDAVDSAMSYVSAQLGRARKGRGGRDGSDQGEVGWVKFDHYTSRPTLEIAKDGETQLVSMKVAGDANLHTHVAVLNVVRTENGRIGSLDLQRLEGRVHEFGAYYQAHLAQNLRAIGAYVELDLDTGSARLTAIPDEARKAFSKRTQDATSIARKWASDNGQDWDTLSADERIELAKRGAGIGRMKKGEAGRDDLSDFDSWRRQADALGWKHEGIIRADAPKTRAVDAETRAADAYRASLPLVDKAFNRSAVVDMAEVRTAATRGLIISGVESAKDIDATVREMEKLGVQQDGSTTRLIIARDGRKVRVTTEAHVGREEDLVAMARAAAADKTAALSHDQIERAVKRSGLVMDSAHTHKQRAAMEQLGTGGRLGVVIGAAGSGKTTLLLPLIDAWNQDGREVYGAAVAWRQVDDLAAAGITRRDRRFALSVLLDRIDQGKETLGRNSVVVVDELGLVGTSAMARLLRIQAKTGAQIVAIGDPAQCQAVEAGPVIDLMRKALGPEHVPELLSTVRQKTLRERVTSGMFREGRASEALARKKEDGALIVVPGSRQDALERVADLWEQRRKANANDPRYSITVTAPTNEDARAVAATIRERRRDGGEVGPDVKVLEATDQLGAIYALPIAVGDKVRLFNNALAAISGSGRGNLGRNGSVVEVTGLTDDGVRLRNVRGTEGVVKWDTLRDKESGRVRLTYGDCLTINAAQGVTSTEHIDAMPSGSRAVNSYTTYVAESRHRRQSWLVTSDGAERREVVDRRPLGDPRPVTADDVVSNIARNLSRRPEKPSALLFLERATETLRESACGLQRAMRPIEERAKAGQEPTTLNKTFRQNRMQESLNRMRKRMAARISVPEMTAKPRRGLRP